MRSSLLLGRIGPLSFSLNYTWLFVFVLGLWGLAFNVLPEIFPDWSTPMGWLAAVLVMGLFLLSVVLRELLRAAIAGFDKRGVILYPFGAATPYRLDDLGSLRALISMVAAIAFNLLLSALLLFAANQIEPTTTLGELARALLIPLGWINLAIGLLNLIPGIPFDGGRIFTNVLVWFTGQREQGLAFTRFVGEVTSLGLVLLGAWVGLTSQNWTLALILAVTGWGAREAEEKGKELNILHTGLSEIRARDLMEETLPQDSVSADASVAEMVLSHPYYASDRPIAVMKNGAASPEGSELVGVITLSKTDDLLQGTWTTTPVTSLMEPPAEVEHFESDTPLTEVIQRIEALGSNPDDLPAVPVIDDGKLVGSIDPSRLAAFEQAEVELGAAEAPIPEASTGFFYRFKRIALAVAVVALLAIVGNAMISSDPYSFRNLQRTASDVPFTITQTIPLADTVASLNGDGTLSIYALAITAQPVTTASLTLDGNPLDLTMASVSPLQQGISASAAEVKDGLHTIVLVVVDRVGRMARTQWQFSTGEIGKSTSQN